MAIGLNDITQRREQKCQTKEITSLRSLCPRGLTWIFRQIKEPAAVYGQYLHHFLSLALSSHLSSSPNWEIAVVRGHLALIQKKTAFVDCMCWCVRKKAVYLHRDLLLGYITILYPPWLPPWPVRSLSSSNVFPWRATDRAFRVQTALVQTSSNLNGTLTCLAHNGTKWNPCMCQWHFIHFKPNKMHTTAVVSKTSSLKITKPASHHQYPINKIIYTPWGLC